MRLGWSLFQSLGRPGCHEAFSIALPHLVNIFQITARTSASGISCMLTASPSYWIAIALSEHTCPFSPGEIDEG